MKLRHLFTVNLFIAVFFGLSCSLFAPWVIQLYGLEPNDAAVWTTRLVGGSILGFATLMWFGRKTELASCTPGHRTGPSGARHCRPGGFD